MGAALGKTLLEGSGEADTFALGTAAHPQSDNTATNSNAKMQRKQVSPFL